MKQLYKGLIPLCIVLCLCLGLSDFTLRTYGPYYHNDVKVIQRLIDENNLKYPKYQPSEWDFLSWSETMPKRIIYMHQPDYTHEKRSYDVVDFSELTELKNLHWYVYKTNVLVLPENLETLSCTESIIEEIDFSHSKKLKEILCTRNNLKSLDLSGMTELEILHCYENQLISLNLSECKKLRELYCDDNQLEELILAEAAPLQLLRCQNNQLSTIDIIEYKSLQELHCGNNKLTELTLDNLPYLTTLYCENNPLQQLYIVDVPSLEILYCSEERGKILLHGNIELISFDYPSRTVTVKAEPPMGKYLGGITGLPEGTEIIDNTATFQLTWSAVNLTPRYWDDSLK